MILTRQDYETLIAIVGTLTEAEYDGTDLASLLIKLTWLSENEEE